MLPREEEPSLPPNHSSVSQASATGSNFQILVGTNASGREKNHQQWMLQHVTRELVTCPQDLDSFGLHLGLPHSEIDRARNNNPNNIEGAAFRLACIWWERDDQPRERKLQVRSKSHKLVWRVHNQTTESNESLESAKHHF